MTTTSETQLSNIVRAAVLETLASLERLPSNRLAYTFVEAGEALGIPWQRVRDSHSRGEFRAKKVGKTWMVTREELLRWLSETR